MSAEGATIPRAAWRSYYGRPILKEPVWKPEIPFYFFTGGLGGTSAGLALLAEQRGNDVLARRAWLCAIAGVGASPALLVSDLGKPSRFLNMLRVFKVTSPMSVGSWLLTASGLATAVAAADAWTPYVPASAGRVARVAAAALGMPLTTYTAALVANTAVPVWHEARATLPFVFAASGATSAGAAAVIATPSDAAAPARRLALGGAAATAVTMELMSRRLGRDLAEPYRTGTAGTLKRVAMGLSMGGAGLIAGLGRKRPAAIAGGALLAGGAICERWSIFRAGFQSAADPKYTVGPQRARIDAGERRGASRDGKIAKSG